MTEPRRDWTPFALLLIDVQRSFWPARRTRHFPHFAANVARLLAFCRAEGIEVIHLRSRFAPDGSDWMPRFKLRGSTPCVAGTAGEETMPYALEVPGETVILKQTLDGFYNPALARHLRGGHKRFLLAAGLVTSTCVFLTTASAAQRGFLTAIVEDCCADDPDAHEQTLDRYGFVFDRTTSNRLVSDRAAWSAALARLDDSATGAGGALAPRTIL